MLGGAGVEVVVVSAGAREGRAVAGAREISGTVGVLGGGAQLLVVGSV